MIRALAADRDAIRLQPAPSHLLPVGRGASAVFLAATAARRSLAPANPPRDLEAAT